MDFYSTTDLPGAADSTPENRETGKKGGIRSQTEGASSREGKGKGASERPRGKMVLSARDEIWIVCYNLRVTYAARFWEASARTREVFQMRRDTIGV